ncbi:hypothetical protein L9F63_016274 [Diploptera punctata]|uniref:Potassium channel domain-containing protein n=1 Tax=Diploptera punctata TaxID=6984 RepID=A0AAD8EHR5_DIPPU|nr:hypothetical protein L9F63_016274 [Diploptera punctata]
MNRACPIVPTPVVQPLYQPSNSVTSDSNRSSPNKVDTNSPSNQRKTSTPYTHHKSQSLPIYINQNEKLLSFVKNKVPNSRNKKVNPENDGDYDDDMDVTCEETDKYEKRHLHRSNYDLHRDINEDEFQQNIPGTVTENCNHSTQIFVKVMNQQPHGSSHRICNIREDKNGGVTIYMSKPFKECDNINTPKQQFDDNHQNQIKRQKENQNLQKHPIEPPKITPRRPKRKPKLQSKKSYNAPSVPSREQAEHQHASGTSKVSPAIQPSDQSELNYDDNRNNEEPIVVTHKSDAIVESSKVIYNENEYPLNLNNKQLDRGSFSSVGVQVSPSPQYRLRFLPICGCTSPENGAAAFRATEGPQEEEVARKLGNKQSELVIELARDLRILKQEEPGWHGKIEYYVDQHKEMLLEAVGSGYGEGGSTGKIWTYPGCLLFAVSLLTTLGFGAPVPRTTLGRMSAVIFSAIGIPLHLLLVLNVGMLVAVKLQYLATRWQPGTSFHKALFQCCCQYKKRKSASPIQRESHIPIDPATSLEVAGFTQSKISVNPSLSPPRWLKWFPPAAILLYYILGVLIFGVGRSQPFAACLLFPLDFTAAGGVGLTSGTVRTCYAIYLEGAVTLAAISVSVLQVSASRGLTDLGLKLGLLTNS